MYLPMDRILYSKFIQYKSLAELTQHEFAGSSATYITIYFDLTDFLFSVPRHVTDIDPYLLASIILNHCAHYREFYRRLGVYARVVLVYTDSYGNSSAEYIPEFNEVFRKRQETAMLDNPNGDMSSLDISLAMVKTLAPYFNELYYIETSFNTSVVIKDLIENVFNEGTPNIVVSNSQFSFQLPCYSDCVVFHKKRRMELNTYEDISYSYNIDTAISSYIYEIKKLYNPFNIHPSMISTLMAMVGIPKFSIKSIFSANRAALILRTMNPNIYGDEFLMYNAIDSKLKTKEAKMFPFSEFRNRYRGIDLNYQHIAYITCPESKNRRFLTRLNDPDKVKSINNNYFVNYPIDLQRL